MMSNAFLSYTHVDDEFHGGAISTFRRLLELGVRVATGDRTFAIFQDKDGIALGDDWDQRLQRAVAEADVFIPIVTPSYLTSASCRRELEAFLAVERNVGRSDLVLPIYFVKTPQLEQPDQITSDELARELSRRQYYDWRTYADEPIETPSIRREIKALASTIANIAYHQQKPPVQQGVEQAVGAVVRDQDQEIEGIPGDFNALTPLLDWDKVHHAVGTWAAYHGVSNAWDMGPLNFLRCLFDLGIPGGKRHELRYRDDGSLTYR